MADALHTPGVTSAAEARLDDAGLIAVQGPGALDTRTGVMWGPGSTELVTGTADTAPMAYLIGPHHWVTSRGVNTDGVYRGALEAAIRVPTTAAPASGSRIDVVYEKQGDANSTISPDSSTAPIYGCVQGAPTTGTPVKPAIPVGAIQLAVATVAAGALSTNDSHVTISNLAGQTVARGCRIPIFSQGERASLAAFPGLEVYRRDTGQVQLCTAVVGGVATWVTTFDPATSVAPTRFLGDADGVDGTVTTSGTVHSLTVTIPSGLPAGMRIRVFGQCMMSTPTGVGAKITVGGRQRTFNQSYLGDASVEFYDTNLTPAARTYTIVVGTTVSGQVVTYRAPYLSACVV